MRGEWRGTGGGAERESGAEGVAAGWGGESGAVGWRKYMESGMDGCTEGERYRGLRGEPSRVGSSCRESFIVCREIDAKVFLGFKDFL